MEVVHQVATFLVGHLVVILTFALGLSLGPGQLQAVVRRPAFRRGLVVALVAVPLITALVVGMLRLPRPQAALLLLMSVCPGVALLVNTVRRGGGDLALGAALSLTLTLAGILLLPVTLPLIDRLLDVDLHAGSGPLLRRVALPVVLSTAAGLAIRRWLPDIARRLLPITMLVFNVALVVAVLVLAPRGLPMLLREPRTFVATVLVTLASAAVGHLAGGPREQDRRTLAVAATFGNPMLALAVVKLSYPWIDALPLVAAYVLVRAVAIAGYLALVRRRAPRPHLPRRWWRTTGFQVEE
jgi:bile acid:Na+ symporter, BASS family